MTAGSRIESERKALGLTQQALADKVVALGGSISQVGIDKIEKRQTLRPRYSREFAMALNVNEDWLLTGNLPKERQGSHLSSHLVENRVATQILPVLGEVRAGAWLEIDGDQHEPEQFIPIPYDTRYRRDIQYALKIVGTSMDKVARPGEFVIVVDWAAGGFKLKDGDLVVVRRERAMTYEVTLKRAKLSLDNSWQLWPESDDPRHQTAIELHDADCEVSVSITGKVVGFYRSV